MAILDPVFANKQGQTPQDIERRRRMAQQLLAQSQENERITSPWQGAAKVAQALMGGFEEARANRDDKTNRASANTLLANTLLGTPGQTGGSMPSVSPSGQIPAQPTTGKEWDSIAPRLVSDLSKDFQLTPEQAAGVVGQLGHESAGFGTMQEVSPTIAGSRGGYGYAQWTGPRRKQFEAWTGENGLDPNSYEANYGFLKNELANSPEGAVLGDLRAAPDAMTAGRMFTDKFLRPGKPNYDSRDAWTNRAMAFAKRPNQVASLDQSIGMPGAASEMQQSAPQPQPMAAQAQAPALPPATNVSTPPVPPNAQQPSSMAGMIPPEFQNSQQLMNADPNKGIMQALLGGTPASQEQVTRAQQIGSQPPAPAGQDRRAQIAALLQNPYTQEAGQQMMMQEYERQQQAQNLILKQQLEQSDPKYRQDLEKGSIELENLRNPRIGPADEANIDLNRDKFKFEQENSQLTPDIKEYNFAKDNGYTGSFAQYQLDLKKSTANNMTINTGEGNKFYNTLDENNAKIFSGLSDAGIQGRSKLGQIDQLENLLNSSGTGAMAVLKQRAGDLGINTEGLSDIQAASAMLSKMIPEQRAPGSGPVSDADLAGFRNSLPRLINQPGGNATIINTMRGLTQYQISMGEIADRVANRELTPAQGREMIASLPNPLSSFKAPPPGKEDEGWQELSPGVRVRKVK